jgi:hypothetical protein
MIKTLGAEQAAAGDGEQGMTHFMIHNGVGNHRASEEISWLRIDREKRGVYYCFVIKTALNVRLLGMCDNGICGAVFFCSCPCIVHDPAALHAVWSLPGRRPK